MGFTPGVSKVPVEDNTTFCVYQFPKKTGPNTKETVTLKKFLNLVSKDSTNVGLLSFPVIGQIREGIRIKDPDEIKKSKSGDKTKDFNYN